MQQDISAEFLCGTGIHSDYSEDKSEMNAAQIPKSDHFKMWSEATMTVTALDNLIPVTWKGETKTRYEHARQKS